MPIAHGPRKKRIAFFIQEKLNNKLDGLSKEHSITKAYLINTAIDEFIANNRINDLFEE